MSSTKRLINAFHYVCPIPSRFCKKKRKEEWNDANLKKESEITKDLFFFIESILLILQIVIVNFIIQIFDFEPSAFILASIHLYFNCLIYEGYMPEPSYSLHLIVKICLKSAASRYNDGLSNYQFPPVTIKGTINFQ